MIKNYYIAFLDILGFRNLIKSKKISEDKMINIFNSFKISKQKEIINNFEVINPSVYIMSDSIILYIDANEKEAFLSILVSCMVVYSNSILNHHIKIRGAIVKGELCVNSKNHIIFGKGLVEAYDLQDKAAKMPRIILTKRTFDDEMRMVTNMQIKRIINSIVIKDFDSYMKLKFIYPEGSENKIKEFQNFLDDELLDYIDDSIREKDLYLIKEIIK